MCGPASTRPLGHEATWAEAGSGILVSSGTCGGVLRLTDRFRLLAVKSVVVSGTQFAHVGAALWSHTGASGVVSDYVITEFGHALASLLILQSILRDKEQDCGRRNGCAPWDALGWPAPFWAKCG